MNKRASFLTRLMAAIILAGFLAGCGGGGSSDSGPDSGADSGPVSGDTSAPQVISTSPFHDSTDVEMDRAITATFSEAVDPATITPDSFSVAAIGTAVPVAGFIDYDAASRTAILIFDSDLASGMAYIATIANAVEDLSGNQMTADYTWQFTTGNILDDIAPTVSHTFPASNASEISLNSALSITFSEAIDPVTINDQTITLKKDGVTSVSGTLIMSGTTVLFRPIAGLSADSLYTAMVTTGIEDLAGNPLAENYTWNFATKAVAPQEDLTPTPPQEDLVPTPPQEDLAPTPPQEDLAPTPPQEDLAPTPPQEDLTPTPPQEDLAPTPPLEDLVPPQVLGVSPEDGTQDVPLDSSISVTFNEPIMAFDFGLIDGRPVAVTFNNDYTTFTLEPTVSLKSGSTYTVNIRSEDLAGNIMPEAYIWDFSTRQ